MNKNKNIKPIAVTLIAIGFFILVKWQFPIYKVASDSMFVSYKSGNYVMVSKLHEFKMSDVVVYNHQDEIKISRVVGVTGDQLKCKNGILFRNNDLVKLKNERHNYRIYCDTTIRTQLAKSLKEVYPNREYIALLSMAEKDSLETKEGVNRIVRIVQPPNGVSSVTKDYDQSYWSKDNFGPVVVPEDGVFLMNDNRANQQDSRTFGVISNQQIVGIIIYSL